MIQPVIDSSGVIHIFKGKDSVPIKFVIGEILTAEIMDIFPTGTIQVKINNRILNAQPQRELPLNKGDTVMVKVEKPLPDGTIPLRVLSTSESEQVQKAIIKAENQISDKIFKLIESLFLTDTRQAKQTQQAQMDSIKELLLLSTENLSEAQKSVLMQKIIDVISHENTVEHLQQLIKLLEKNNFPEEEIARLKNIIISDNEELTTEKLKNTILNTGVSFEAKMKQALFDTFKIEQIKEDLKAILDNISKQAKTAGLEEIADKAQHILREIEGYQVLSKTYQSFFTFLPLLWNAIDGGNFAFRTFKKQGKDYHTVFINLRIKEESISFVVTMINKSFFVSFSGKPETMQIIKNYEEELKERFHRQGLFLSGINYVTKIEELLKQWQIQEGLVSVII
ncbi:hypothetical protein V4D30_08025 [Thermodesulfovibrio sp. 3907-1M]|uniref:Flagellar hook-length control protein FliK n=1 Tax=Thermodesulfovibrio autotrophicus TaxID=3118333 RepID=A0AAU8GVM5_9BACT